MIPLRDDVPSRSAPVATVLLILINLLVFLYQLSLPAEVAQQFTVQHSVIPARLGQLAAAPASVAAQTLQSIFTAMFLHAGWLHLLGNLWFLWIFGDNVEDRLGHLRYVVLYLAGGIVGSLAHIFFNSGSQLPSIGASGAVAGVLGAYLMSYPFARIRTVIPLLILWPVIELPALIVLGAWFGIQLLSGFFSLADPGTTGGVAWWAHVGGFLTGVILVRLLAKPPIQRYRWGTSHV